MDNIRLTKTERTDLIAFLMTLNDASFVFNTDQHIPRNVNFEKPKEAVGGSLLHKKK